MSHTRYYWKKWLRAIKRIPAFWREINDDWHDRFWLPGSGKDGDPRNRK